MNWKYKIQFKSLIKNETDIYTGILEERDGKIFGDKESALKAISQHALMSFPEAEVILLNPVVDNAKSKRKKPRK